MSISFQCPACGKAFTVGDQLAGRKGKCKQCGTMMSIPMHAEPLQPDDLYDLEEVTDDPLPPRAAPPRPSAMAGGPRPRGASGSKTSASGDGGKKGLFAGIGGTAFVVIYIVVKLASIGSRVANLNNGPAAPPQVPPILGSAPAQVSNQPWTMPALPNRGTMSELQPGVMFQELRIGPGHANPNLPPGHGMTLYFYLPPGDHKPGSLPCVLIAPAGSILITGMDLGEGDQAEHLPYVQAGFAVLAYSLDGHLADLKSANERQIQQASMQFLNAKSGLTNAKVALEWLSAKVPEVDPQRIYAAGHSSAGTFALLLAEHDPRIKKCAAFAPRTDVDSNFDERQKGALGRMIPGLDEFFSTYNPKTNPREMNCPVLLFHAKGDTTVPVSESENFAAALQAVGKDVTLVTVPGGDHYNSMIQQGIPKAIRWFKDHDSAAGGGQ